MRPDAFACFFPSWVMPSWPCDGESPPLAATRRSYRQLAERALILPFGVRGGLRAPKSAREQTASPRVVEIGGIGAEAPRVSDDASRLLWAPHHHGGASLCRSVGPVYLSISNCPGNQCVHFKRVVSLSPSLFRYLQWRRSPRRHCVLKRRTSESH